MAAPAFTPPPPHVVGVQFRPAGLVHDARRLCLRRVRERGLPVKLAQVEWTFDGGTATFFFRAEGRVDVRELVRDLANGLRTRIEMTQIGSRDETRLLGGVGPCGRELCCSTWLREFQAVSIRMAKEQGPSLDPSKLSGTCAAGSVEVAAALEDLVEKRAD